MHRAQVGGGVDAFEQFARRMSLVMRLDQTTIQPMEFDSGISAYAPIPGTAPQNVYSSSARACSAFQVGHVGNARAWFETLCNELDLQ